MADLDREITFYCKGDFIKKVEYMDSNNEKQAVWSDTAYYYIDSEGAVQNVPIFRVAAGHLKAPGSEGSKLGSFTTIGQYDLKYSYLFHYPCHDLIFNRFQGNNAQWRHCRL